ncbi:carbohydrate porin [Phreatobacter aquaticus]|uniref:Carbohydrate porin n=1 Tax=Phreatobacter aquaticus TaxID=2570229 RepID=A0A4D7QJF7_9HYPH|nr:carbohydrate porin [Phreatobacter aquaticus]QCK85514.1 carbohydrate porin [Phreatobacter aquaticus]
MPRRSRPMQALALVAILACLSANTARADQPEVNADGVPLSSIATLLPGNGDAGGHRKWLAERGITYTLLYTGDLLGNVSGGLRRGWVNQGKLEASVSIDLEKLAGIQGLSFYSNAFFIHNNGRIRRDYVGGINTIAAIEAVPTTRLSELWFEQKFWSGQASFRVGQLAADTEFFFSGISALFLQSDWATIAALNLPSGGPAYPLATPGVRLKVDPNPNWSLLFALFNGDPAGPGANDEQLRNRYGLNFRVTDRPLIMGETQYRINRGREDTGLASQIKLGFWGHLGRFADQRYASDGLLLANPLSSGVAAVRRGNWGLYAVMEQQIYRPAGGDADSGISLFGRISYAPSDRSTIGFYADGGIVFAGLIPGRPDDKFGASLIYARYSDAARAFDRDVIAQTGIPGVVRDYEANLELTYQAQMTSGWTMQPVLTYVWHPSGDARRNAVVTGVRSMIRW